jgi:uncharacterized protein (DUF302 family)
MKNINLVALLIFALLFNACQTANTEQKEVNNNMESQNTSIETEKTSVERHIKVKSENNFNETYAALKKAIESKEPLTIIAELDHSANAKKAGMELRPTKVIMFGNPKLGTPLMKENQAIGIDLPQKMLVYEDEKGDVYVVYNDPKILAENHNISGQDEILNKISEALKGLAETATKKKEK